MSSFRPVFVALFGAFAVALAACGGGGSPSPAATSGGGGSPAAAGKPSTAAAPPIPSASVIGQKAPGPFQANAAVSVTTGAATIEATDALKWQPNTILAGPGDKITLTIRNNGNTVHTFVSPAMNVAQTDVPIQKTSTVSFSAPSAPGAYQFWCNIPGHAEAGMVGQVIVQ